MYKPSYVPSNLSVAYSEVVELVVEPTPLNVYFKRDSGKLGHITLSVEDHEEAILATKEHLVGTNEGWNAPVLAVINGGKNERSNYAGRCRTYSGSTGS